MQYFDDVEQQEEKILKDNEEILISFAKHLKDEGLTAKTGYNHIDNISFYINKYLLYFNSIPAAQGAVHISGFLGDFFVRKAMWANVSQIKQYITSLKKFYRFMEEQGLTDSDDVIEMLATIKEKKQEWLTIMQRYDDPDVEFKDVWEFDL